MVLKEKVVKDLVKVEPKTIADFWLKFDLQLIDDNSWQPKLLTADEIQTITMLSPCWFGQVF